MFDVHVQENRPVLEQLVHPLRRTMAQYRAAVCLHSFQRGGRRLSVLVDASAQEEITEGEGGVDMYLYVSGYLAQLRISSSGCCFSKGIQDLI